MHFSIRQLRILAFSQVRIIEETYFGAFHKWKNSKSRPFYASNRSTIFDQYSKPVERSIRLTFPLIRWTLLPKVYQRHHPSTRRCTLYNGNGFWIKMGSKNKGPTRIRTGVVRIRTESDNHYTIGPFLEIGTQEILISTSYSVKLVETS